MRWPIQFQLLLPTLSVVVLAIALASAASAYFGGMRARQTQEDNLHRVVDTLSEAKFPLTEPVLVQMSGLSGAKFVLLDLHDAMQAGTLPVDAEEIERLRRIPRDQPSDNLAARPTVSVGGHVYLCQRVTVASRDPTLPPGSLFVLYPEDRWSAGMRQAAYPAIITGVVAVVAVALVSTVLAHRFVQPIRQLGQRAAAIAHGDFQPMPLSPRNDELRDLAVSINRMTEQLGQYENEVRRNEQLRTLGQLGAGMAHQLRNAATGGRMAIELHQRECPAGESGESLAVALRQLRLMESYLQRFLALGRDRAVSHERLSLPAIVADALTLVRPACSHAGIDLVFHQPSTPLWVMGDADALRQLTVNLVLNAVEALGSRPEHARIVVELESQDGAHAAIRVQDTGPGPDPVVAQRLFEPFVTGKPEGSGLGLYVARQVAEAHQGSIGWQRIDGQTRFTVVLPLVRNP